MIRPPVDDDSVMRQQCTNYLPAWVIELGAFRELGEFWRG
jgi:hypothetical protein